ncbi:dolichyl-phosphate beta-glucosyltransferase [Schistocerca americana]|uniref:dolichyl-phosphate beta-glucosyltransferase n=1 Tax=Schistocerca americana TaxID=7009 RepID=UPI001F4F4E75|nr:dolichyl-phosphate beta-glucosyltransferase [Schistocerca americana]
MELLSHLWCALSAAVLAGIILVLLLSVILKVVSFPYPIIDRSSEEKTFCDENSVQQNFPDLEDTWNIHLSVVVPAYNEETRLPPMLDECLDFLEKRNGNFKYEIIVVSDGSTDNTVSVASQYTKKFGSEKVRVLKLVKNRGKGGAVRLGVLSSRGAVILFADADGATKFSELEKLETSLQKLTGGDYTKEPDGVEGRIAVVCGSRAHLEEEAIATRSMFRTLLMHGFHFLVWLFAVRGIRDTQCGFKLFTRETARMCFHNMHVERWAFDVELLYIAQKLKIPVAEVAVDWTEIEGSKIVPVWSWLQMGKDLLLIWFRYHIGAWKLRKKSA